MNNGCRRCGKEVKEGEMYCPECQDSVATDKPRRIWLFAGLFSALMLLLAGMLLWHGQAGTWDLSWDRLMGRPVAMINGEAIGRQDFRARVAATRLILERQYGEEIFSGKEGKARLLAFQKELLDRMVEERLVAQEAKRLDIRISNEQVEQELRRIAGEIYGSLENFQKRLAGDGMTEEGLKNHIRTNLTVQAVMQAKSATVDRGIQPELSFAAWLTQSKKAAKVVVYDTSSAVASSPSRGGGCCGIGGSSSSGSGCGGKGSAGGCGTKGSGGPIDAQTEKKAKEATLAAYKKIDGSTQELKMTVSDYGCHIQVDVAKDGKTVKSYSYRDGQVFEI